MQVNLSFILLVPSGIAYRKSGGLSGSHEIRFFRGGQIHACTADSNKDQQAGSDEHTFLPISNHPYMEIKV
jgi:hypothetical protein